jgi:hypothetical protein
MLRRAIIGALIIASILAIGMREFVKILIAVMIWIWGA